MKAWDFFRRSLMAELVAFFLFVALIPIGIVGYLSFGKAREALKESTASELSAARDRGRDSIVDYLEATMGDAAYLGRSPGVQSAFKTLSDYLDYASFLDYAKSHPDAPVDVGSPEFKKVLDDLDPMFTRFLENFQSHKAYQDILLVVGKDSGLVLYSAKKLSDLGVSLRSGEFKANGLGKLWERVIRGGKPGLSDFGDYEPDRSVSAFVGVPVLRDDKSLLGVLVLRLAPTRINEVMGRVAQMGHTGDSFTVGEDLLLRSNSRRLGDGILKTKVDTKATREAVQGKSGIAEMENSTGVSVLTAWSPMGLPLRNGLGADFDWGIVAQIDSGEAFRSVYSLRVWIILVALCIGLVVAGLAMLLARTIAKPITAVAETATRISEGDLTVDVPRLKRIDELGALATAFNRMVRNLRGQIGQLMEGTNVLSASASQILATVSHVSQSTSQTSAAVSETSTTVEQLKQAARLSGEKAKSVAEESLEAVRISEAGQKATQDSIRRIGLISEQMESIGRTVVKLSTHSQAIENIITTVQDLADQSNLLAVNASIEAARAGDMGKGFAVVANEIKVLADQSREATGQVRAILDDTRKWVNAVVMAAEQGGKAVEAGVAQSVVAGDSIRNLASTVSSSSQAASVIDASSRQQLSGVDQVSKAMSNIEQAVSQNLEGTSQLQTAAKRLDELAGSLKRLVERYKT